MPRVVRHVRPKCSCRRCEAISQAPAPSLPILRGRAGPGLLAHVLVSRYADHLPLCRQAGILAREGVVLGRSTLADWVGQCAALLRPLVEALERHVMAASVLHADGYAGLDSLWGGGRVIEAACWAHARRRFFDRHATRHSPPRRCAASGCSATSSAPSAAARPTSAPGCGGEQAAPVLQDLHAWLTATLARVPGRGDLAGAIRSAPSRWTALTRQRDDGRLAIDNAAERATRPVVPGRRNRLLAGSDAGGTRAAAIASLLETARMNGIDPEAYLRHVLGIIADHPARRVAELLPWAVPDLATRLDQRASG